MSKAAGDDETAILIQPTARETDIQAVKDALGVSSVNFNAWVSSLDFSTLHSMIEKFDSMARSGNITGRVGTMTEAIIQFKALVV